ncbi:Protein SMG7 [Lachnellula subtilissima]|uniref:Nonsense-mediated mRNA decay factor n=1 Tax=Lachnellula subtilissima TaxID=602034 RepID=A0A8H8UBQ1_9HELO|nr:Protein SMG7 [Lachnellula subtilissima]
MASPASKPWKRASQLAKHLSLLLDDKSPPFEDVDNLIEHVLSQTNFSRLRLACEATILIDIKFAHEHDVEKCLWDSHIRINQRYRKRVDHYKQEDPKKHVVERRKLEKRYADFIKTSQFFYKGYIQRLASRFEGMKELRRIAHRLSLDTQSVDQRVQVSPDIEHLIDSSCYGTLLRLGDLSRYRNHLRTKDRSWAAALGYYELANDFLPDDGTAHNQMAVVALADGNHLDAVYHLYRALAIKKPFDLAKGNLEIEFKKIKTSQEKQRVPPKTDTLSTLVWWFVLLHAKFYDGVDFQTHEELENEVLSRLALLLKEESFKETLEKVVLINLSAEYFAGQRIKDAAGSASSELIRSYYFFLTLNLRMNFMLLQVLQPELEDQPSGEDLPAGTDAPTRISSGEKVTAVARRVLPALRQYSVWLASQATVIIASDEIGPVVIHANEMWKMYADVLTRLAHFYPVDSLRSVNYLLEEDETTVGFKPLRDPTLPGACNLFVDDDGGLKLHITDPSTKRSLPNEEMQARVRDIIICALVLHQDVKCPIILEPETAAFMFIEEGLAMASPSSPIQYQESTPSERPLHNSIYPTASFESHQQSSNNFAVPETVRRNIAVIPAESVAASDSYNSIDISMNHMVDSLVEPSGSKQTASNETSYGMHSRTANEVFAPIGTNGFRSHQVQSPPKMLPSLPGLWKSAFTPQPNELQSTSPRHYSTGRQMSPMPLSNRQEQLEAAEHLERVTGYRRSSKERLENMVDSQDMWGGKWASNPSSQAINEILQRKLAEQLNPMTITSSSFSDSSSLYANNTPLAQQQPNGRGIRGTFGQFAPTNTANNSTFYAGGTDFDTDAMLRSSIWNGSQPRHGNYSQTPPGNQGG